MRAAYVWALAIATLSATAAHGSTKYLTSDGSDSDDGSTLALSYATMSNALSSGKVVGGDTLYVAASEAEPVGTWTITDIYQLIPHTSCSGTASAPTYIMAYPGAEIIISGAARTGTGQYAFHFQNSSPSVMRDGYRFERIIFEDWENVTAGDAPPTADATTGAVLISGAPGVTSEPYWFVDCVWRLNTEDNGTTAIYAGAAVGPIGGLYVYRCSMTGINASGINVGDVRPLVVEDCVVDRQVSGELGGDKPNGIVITNNSAENAIIRNTDVSGFDHGVIFNGVGHLVDDCDVHDNTDDGAYLDASGNICQNVTVQDSRWWNNGDDMIEVQGSGHRVIGNTFYNTNSPDVGWLVAADPCTSCVIQDNIIADSNTGSGILISGAGSSVTFGGNRWYQPNGGTLTFMEIGVDTTTVFSEFQAWDYGADTDDFARPYFAEDDTSNVGLAPTVDRRGISGRTIGALPLGGQYAQAFDLSGLADADSVWATVKDPAGRTTRYMNGAMWWDHDGDTATIDFLAVASGVWSVEWRVWDGGTDTKYRDALTVPREIRMVIGAP